VTAAQSFTELVPLEVSQFRFPDPALADRRGIVMCYAIRHAEGVFLFDTGFGFDSDELNETYHPTTRPIGDALSDAGIAIADVTALANCHLHGDHAGQNSAFAGVPIHVQPVEWELAHTADHTIVDWVDFPGIHVVPRSGDHEPVTGIRVVATPGHTPGHQSLVIKEADGLVVLAGQACYSVGEWIGDPTAIEGRTSSSDRAAYDRSIERLRGFDPVRVYFAHDRAHWSH
jgi:glyoxylase-like metal-dependent hydrolase (beta-lactamase superfamily II)